MPVPCKAEPIDTILVRGLIDSQFPQWAALDIAPVEPGGWDNRTFRLGDEMSVRLPSAAGYAAQVDKEHAWLPKLAPLLPLPIPTPLAVGQPGLGYPWKWSVRRWLDGIPVTRELTVGLDGIATALSQFLAALQSIDPTAGPLPGPENFYRGGSLLTYDAQTRKAIRLLEGRIDASAAIEAWESSVARSWKSPPVWVHGDVSPGNLLLQEGRLHAVIDFGMLAVGDPACDLAIAWTLFEGESRQVFREMLPLDSGAWLRGRGWALWKALIVAANMTRTNALEAAQPWRVVNEVLASHAKGGDV